MQIDFLFDAVCPWCYIGKRRLEEVLAGRQELDVTVNWRAFLLNPELPSNGMERSTYLASKIGSQSRIRRVYGTISDVGLSVEIGFNFDTIRHTPNSIDAHRLVHFADQQGKAEMAVEALFEGYFVNGANIGEAEVLCAMAEGLGLDAGAFAARLATDEGIVNIYDANAQAHRLGINGVPSYVFNEHLVISGAQEATVLNRMLDAALAMKEE